MATRAEHEGPAEAQVRSYTGHAQFGDDGSAVELVVHIPDVEHPEWFAQVTAGAAPPLGEGVVTLLDEGIYNAWRGSAVITEGSDGQRRLLGHSPLVPPIGA
jgi:hypothetical protein